MGGILGGAGAAGGATSALGGAGAAGSAASAAGTALGTAGAAGAAAPALGAGIGAGATGVGSALGGNGIGAGLSGTSSALGADSLGGAVPMTGAEIDTSIGSLPGNGALSTTGTDGFTPGPGGGYARPMMSSSENVKPQPGPNHGISDLSKPPPGKSFLDSDMLKTMQGLRGGGGGGTSYSSPNYSSGPQVPLSQPDSGGGGDQQYAELVKYLQGIGAQ